MFNLIRILYNNNDNNKKKNKSIDLSESICLQLNYSSKGRNIEITSSTKLNGQKVNRDSI